MRTMASRVHARQLRGGEEETGEMKDMKLSVRRTTARAGAAIRKSRPANRNLKIPGKTRRCRATATGAQTTKAEREYSKASASEPPPCKIDNSSPKKSNTLKPSVYPLFSRSTRAACSSINFSRDKVMPENLQHSPNFCQAIFHEINLAQFWHMIRNTDKQIWAISGTNLAHSDCARP